MSSFEVEWPMSSAIRRLRTSASLLAALPLTACLGSTTPFGYDKIQHTAEFVPEEHLDRMVNDHWTRSAVVADLGDPDAENARTRTIGYERCIVSDAKSAVVVVLPLPIWGSVGNVSHCQLVKLWLDDSDRVVRWSDRVGVKEIPPEGPQVYNLGCTLDALLEGAHCVDNRGLFGKDWDEQR